MRVEMTSPNPKEGGKEQGCLPELPSADAGPSPRSPDGRHSDWLPCAYRGSMEMFAEECLAKRIGSMPFGTRRHERWHDGVLQHRCTDIKTGAWIVIARGSHKYADPVVIDFRDRASSRDEGGLRDEPENPLLQATGGENGR